MRLGIFATIRSITDYQQGLFEEILAPIDDSSHIYRYGVPFKTRNMPVLPITNIDDTLTFSLMRLTEKIDTNSSRGSGWEFYRVKKVFIEVIQFMPLTGASYISLTADLSAKKGVVNHKTKIMNALDGQFYQPSILYHKMQKEFRNTSNIMILLISKI